MPETGGSTTQSGIYYQNTIAARFLGRMLDPRLGPASDRVVEVRTEAPVYVDDILVTYADGHRCFIQVKENIDVNGDAWKKMWADFEKQRWEKSFHDGDRLVLFIGNPSDKFDMLEEICDRAHGSVDFAEWMARLTTAQKKLLTGIRGLLSDACQEGTPLWQLFFATETRVETPKMVEEAAISLMPQSSIDETALFAVLVSLVGENARNKANLTADSLISQLQSRNIEIQPIQKVEAVKTTWTGTAETSVPTEILRGSLPFEEGDALPLRERDIQQLYTLMSSRTFRFGVLSGESGCGKTSLLQAGLIPLLRKKGMLPIYIPSLGNVPYLAINDSIDPTAHVRQPRAITPQDLLARLSSAAAGVKNVTVLIDQFEQFLDTSSQNGIDDFLNWLCDTAADTTIPVVFLISIQASWLNKLQQNLSRLPGATLPKVSFQLQNFDPPQAEQVLKQAVSSDFIDFTPELILAVIHDLERNGSIRPAELQRVATRLKLKNITRVENYVPPVMPRVLAITFNPVINAATGETLIAELGYNDPKVLVKEFIDDIYECSDGLVLYQIVERNNFSGQIELSSFPVNEKGTQYTPQGYAEALKNFTFTDGMLDYNRVMQEFNLLQRINNREFDEVWLFGFPGAGFYESVMAGKGAFWCNGPELAQTESCQRKFFIMGFNYERSTGEMLETLGHRAESILQKVFQNKRGDANLYEKFILYDKVASGNAQVGTIHYAPNSQQDYDWGNPTLVRSFCDDWYQFPDMTGMNRIVNAEEWGGGDTRAHHKWWFKHLPHAAGEKRGIANNWWRYIVDPNNVKSWSIFGLLRNIRGVL